MPLPNPEERDIDADPDRIHALQAAIRCLQRTPGSVSDDSAEHLQREIQDRRDVLAVVTRAIKLGVYNR